MLNLFLLFVGVTVGIAGKCVDGSIPYPALNSIDQYECVDWKSEFNLSMKYLERNIPAFDVPNKVTLGFNGDEEILCDRVVSRGVNISLSARSNFKWAADVDRQTFLEFVLPYSNVNEARTDWRELLYAADLEIFNQYSPSEWSSWDTEHVVHLINDNLWSNNTILGKTVVFRSQQTPLIYDIMSVLSYGYGSCTGVSIFLIGALRSAGIAARIVGTPAWNQDISHGNHNWVEVWLPSYDDAGNSVSGSWEFFEASPAGPGESLSNPCDKWFCNPSNFANGTRVYAARFDQDSEVRYPMAWDVDNTDIPGVDRTDYYQKACMACV